MNNVFNSKYKEKLNSRDLLQNKFDLSFAESDFDSLRNHYRSLRKIELKSSFDVPCEAISISSLAENLSIACDIICNENGTSFIYCGNSTSMARGNQRLITKAILNLLSNAFLYGRGNFVTVKTVEKNGFISIEIQNSGWLDNDFTFCEGLNFVNNLCNKLNGHFFISTDLLSVKAVMLIPKSTNYKDIATTPDFCELLGDRLSPVYVEFFGIEN